MVIGPNVANRVSKRSAARLLGRLLRDRRGQALVEFAIVAPLMVLILLFAIWLWEIVEVKLKVQEAARYAAWEATAYRLHDYYGGKPALPMAYANVQLDVARETMWRFSNLDSTAGMSPAGGSMVVASWMPPQVFFGADCAGYGSTAVALAITGDLIHLPVCGNEPEEVLPIGALGNAIFDAVTPIAGAVMALRYRSKPFNPVAEMLIRAGGPSEWNIFGAGAREIGFSRQIDMDWGFNPAGYIHVLVSLVVKNNWFNVRLLGRPLFQRDGFVIKEEYGLLADSWRLNYDELAQNEPATLTELQQMRMEAVWLQQQGRTGDAEAINQRVDHLEHANQALQDQLNAARARQGLGLWPFRARRGAFWAMVDRIYLGMPKARRGASKFINTFFLLPMRSALRLMGGGAYNPQPPGLLDEDWVYASVASLPYRRRLDKPNEIEGPIEIKQDLGTFRYDTLPNINEYRRTFEHRGRYFMGCPQPQQLGCTDTLSQDNPLGDFIRRE